MQLCPSVAAITLHACRVNTQKFLCVLGATRSFRPRGRKLLIVSREPGPARRFPAGYALAYNSHHAPSGAALLLAERWQFTPTPVFTLSLILLGVLLALSGALQHHKQEHRVWLPKTSKEAWLRDRKNVWLPRKRYAPRRGPSHWCSVWGAGDRFSDL